jgi:hypothetical protein
MALLRSGTRIYGNAKIDTVLDIDGQDAATSNVTGALKVAGGIGVKGNVFSTGNVTALNASLGNLVIANYYQGTLTTNAQPNITSVGSLTSLTVTGNFTGNNATLSGNLVVNGNLVYANVSTVNIKDPIIEQGGGVDGTPLTTDDLKDRGTLLHYYTTAPVDAFMGWDNSNGEFSFGSNVTVTNEVVTFNTLGNIRANVFLGNLSGSASTVTASNQPNITSIGTLSNLSVTSNISASNISGTITTASQTNITTLGSLSGLTVVGPTNLGPAANVRITGGSDGYVLKTDGTGNLSWGSASSGTGNANISGSNTQIFFNDANNSSLGTSANLTFNKSNNTLTVDKIIADGGLLTNVAASTSTTAGTVTTNAQPNITSLGTLANLSVSGNVNFTGPNVSLGAVGNLHITGGTPNYVLQTDGTGNLTWVSAGAALQSSGGIAIVSTISNIVAGSAIDVSVSYADANYPGGKYTIAQLGPVSLGATDVWYTGSTSKNAYANFIAGTVNTQNVNVTFSLANATFNVQSSDYINIGSSNITGANLVALNITGNGTYTIPSAYLTAANTQTNSTVAVTANLTTSRGAYTATGTTLTNLQPVPFNVTALSGSFPSATVPYWSLNQTFNWNATTTSGATVASGNVTYANTANSISGTLTSAGATSGTSTSLDSTMNYTITSSDYFGAGQYGAGSRSMTATVNGTVTAATKYYPLFWKITANSTLPTFTVSDSRNSNTYATGQGATTSTTSGDHLWLAIPNYPSNSSSLASHTFKHVFGGFDIVDTPTVTGTQTITSGGQSYNYSIYGFSGFTTASTIITTS